MTGGITGDIGDRQCRNTKRDNDRGQRQRKTAEEHDRNTMINEGGGRGLGEPSRVFYAPLLQATTLPPPSPAGLRHSYNMRYPAIERGRFPPARTPHIVLTRSRARSLGAYISAESQLRYSLSVVRLRTPVSPRISQGQRGGRSGELLHRSNSLAYSRVAGLAGRVVEPRRKLS